MAARTISTSVLFLISATCLSAQTPNNLQVCLSGKYPSLCNHAALAPEQLKQAKAAELRENLNICQTGKYPSLCDHSKLTQEQADSVQEAERQENLRICSTGQYRMLCNHSLLSTDEQVRVETAERAQNLKICLDGKYSSICDHSLLTSDQAQSVTSAEQRSKDSQPRLPATAPVRHSGGCESGHSISDVKGDGKIIELDDGSIWEVDDVDTVDTALWLAASDVVVCSDKIINLDEKESADVTLIGHIGNTAGSGAKRGYPIEASANDETFVINGEVFKAKAYCFDFDRGDRIIFVEGSAFGACASAKFLNLRNGKMCDAWCE